MGDGRVLVAFANQAGSTAGIASTIAAVLGRTGFTVDCRLAAEVRDLAPYDAVVLGSGVFLPRRRSDGGGFLARHEAALAGRPLWLFCAGPIGRGRCRAGAPPGHSDDWAVVNVARAVGARGAAVFGPIALVEGADPIEHLVPVNVQRVRAWAAEIAEQLRASAPAGSEPERQPRPAPGAERGAPNPKHLTSPA